MESYATAFQPFLRSCKQECDNPIEGEQKGEIPKWLKGCLIRVGSGLLEVGPDKYNHLFDGLALMHRFTFIDGKVTYQSRFLRSDVYRANMKSNRIVRSEFATKGVPDPCKTIFQRFASMFSAEETTDNDLVNIILFGNEAYASTESNCIWQIDPENLNALKKVNLSDYLPVNAAVAHAHEDKDGTVYNIGSLYGRKPSYNILKFPQTGDNNKSTFENSSVVCRIPSSNSLKLSYHHSFGMTDNYFVFIEQPLFISIPKLAAIQFTSSTFADAMHWDDKSQVRFHVVRRSDGSLLDTVYVSKAFFTFHHISAYEEDNQLIVDIAAYDDGQVMKSLYINALKELYSNEKNPSDPLAAKARRYILPLIVPDEKDEKKNLVNLTNSSASAHVQPNGNIVLEHEVLTASENWFPELPRINYKFNGRKYRYFYSMARKETIDNVYLIKVDTVDKTTSSWCESGVIPSEPVFLEEPGAEDEDSGVLLASLLYREDERKVSMIVLNAKTMTEIARVNFITQSSVPGDFHGTFISKQ